ncbi:MAG: HAD family hydrolase [Candidatus Kapaibacterium sp.]
MNKAILYDFDGVIIRSTGVKTEAFREMFMPYGEDIAEKLLEYHIEHGGISRYRKFRYVYEELLGKPYTTEIGQKLGRQFSSLILDKVKQSPMTEGIIPFLKKHRNKYLQFIVSGTPHSELFEVVRSFGIMSHFDGIWGSPPHKSLITRRIVCDFDIDTSGSCFIGDAETDYQSAKDNGLKFILVESGHSGNLKKRCEVCIKDFSNLNL